MKITSDAIRGYTETIILANLSHQDSYGYQINKDIAKRTSGRYELKEATLYSAFKRLEDHKYILSYWGESEGGARRRYYKITTLGKEHLQKSLEEWEVTKELIDLLLKEDRYE